ncbi:acetyltransferase [Streptacidiphilus sp. PB12-B1b]|uniref:acyltransferase family protein n=1 Tax=Streptacidiphilus sp. PB12-B1b TaxID=2705012 RepID=UPI0015FC9356|nr:acyltransferase family protein [Streptacidiphilus sp. PB12-B1b]QMU77138.1 acetyltransferase [Streptacidiphilus sp. PB12-B1b]
MTADQAGLYALPARPAATPAPAHLAARATDPQTDPQTDPATGPAPRVRAAGTGREPGLDGVRALAVAAVLVFHVHAGWLSGGFLGVDVFFVLSGYLITSLLTAERAGHGRIRLRRFWGRRARRLLPELLLVLLVTAAATAALGRDAAAGLRGSELAALGFYSNWWQIRQQTGYFAQFGPLPLLQHLWSLGIEEQFYLLWPPVLAALSLLNRRRAAAVAAALAVASFTAMAAGSLAGADTTRLYFGSDTHAGPLLLGSAAGLLLPPERVRALGRRARTALGAAGLAALVVLGLLAVQLDGAGSTAYRGGIAAAALAAAALCPASVAAGPLRWLLAVRALVWTGRRSYGIYLWHWPLIAALGYTGLGTGPAVDVLEFALPVALAAGSFRLLQQPVTRWGWRVALARSRAGWRRQCRRFPRSLHVAATASALIPILAVHALVAAPQTTALQAQLQAGRRAATEAAVTAAAPAAAPAAGARPGATGAPDARQEAQEPVQGSSVTAVGDSVMLAAAPALEQALPGIDIHALVGRQMSEAPAVLEQLLAEGRLRSTVVVGLGTNGDVDPATLRRLAELAGPQRTLALVDVHAPRVWEDEVNTALTGYVRQHPGTVLVPWSAAAAAHPRLLYADHIHPRPEGGPLYADTLVAALDRQRPGAAPR